MVLRNRGRKACCVRGATRLSGRATVFTAGKQNTAMYTCHFRRRRGEIVRHLSFAVRRRTNVFRHLNNTLSSVFSGAYRRICRNVATPLSSSLASWQPFGGLTCLPLVLRCAQQAFRLLLCATAAGALNNALLVTGYIKYCRSPRWASGTPSNADNS